MSEADDLLELQRTIARVRELEAENAALRAALLGIAGHVAAVQPRLTLPVPSAYPSRAPWRSLGDDLAGRLGPR